MNAPKQVKNLITRIDETNIINLLKTNNLGYINLEEYLRSETITTYLNVRDDIYTKLTNKISCKLKKYIDLAVIDKSSYLEFMELIKTDGVLYTFCQRYCHYLGHNNDITFNNIIMKLQTKIRVITKKFKTNNVSLKKNTENGYIYLIRTRASLNVKENVYKFGKTSKPYSIRMNGYDKGYETILVLPIKLEMLDSLEIQLLEQLSSQFKKRDDYGNEYFEGNRLDICKLIFNSVSSIN